MNLQQEIARVAAGTQGAAIVLHVGKGAGSWAETLGLNVQDVITLAEMIRVHATELADELLSSVRRKARDLKTPDEEIELLIMVIRVQVEAHHKTSGTTRVTEAM